MKLFILITFIFLYTRIEASEMAITIDDLPLRSFGAKKELIEKNNKFLETLKKFDIKSVAFVNEQLLYGKKESLQAWIDNGHEIGNHTYSHKIINNVGFELFKQDIIRGEKISKEIMENSGLKLKYFRHPGLGTGKNLKERKQLADFLQEREYIVAPVTIDTNDWRFNKYYLNASSAKKKIIFDRYLNFIKTSIRYSENTMQQLFGRNIKHIILMHAIQINIDHLEEVLQTIKDASYEFISLEDALKDEVYSIDGVLCCAGGDWTSRWRKALSEKNPSTKYKLCEYPKIDLNFSS